MDASYKGVVASVPHSSAGGGGNAASAPAPGGRDDFRIPVNDRSGSAGARPRKTPWPGEVTRRPRSLAGIPFREERETIAALGSWSLICCFELSSSWPGGEEVDAEAGRTWSRVGVVVVLFTAIMMLAVHLFQLKGGEREENPKRCHWAQAAHATLIGGCGCWIAAKAAWRQDPQVCAGAATLWALLGFSLVRCLSLPPDDRSVADVREAPGTKDAHESRGRSSFSDVVEVTDSLPPASPPPPGSEGELGEPATAAPQGAGVAQPPQRQIRSPPTSAPTSVIVITDVDEDIEPVSVAITPTGTTDAVQAIEIPPPPPAEASVMPKLCNSCTCKGCKPQQSPTQQKRRERAGNAGAPEHSDEPLPGTVPESELAESVEATAPQTSPRGVETQTPASSSTSPRPAREFAAAGATGSEPPEGTSRRSKCEKLRHAKLEAPDCELAHSKSVPPGKSREESHSVHRSQSGPSWAKEVCHISVCQIEEPKSAGDAQQQRRDSKDSDQTIIVQDEIVRSRPGSPTSGRRESDHLKGGDHLSSGLTDHEISRSRPGSPKQQLSLLDPATSSRPSRKSLGKVQVKPGTLTRSHDGEGQGEQTPPEEKPPATGADMGDRSPSNKPKDDLRPVDPEKLRDALLANIRRRRVMIGDFISGARLEEMHEACARDTDEDPIGSRAFHVDLFGAQDDEDFSSIDVNKIAGSSGMSDFTTMRETIMNRAAGLQPGPSFMASMAGNSQRESRLNSRRTSVLSRAPTGVLRTSISASPVGGSSRLSSRRVSFAQGIGASPARSPALSAKASPRASFRGLPGDLSTLTASPRRSLRVGQASEGAVVTVSEVTDDNQAGPRLSLKPEDAELPRLSVSSASNAPLAAVAETGKTSNDDEDSSDSETGEDESKSTLEQSEEALNLPSQMLEFRNLLAIFPSRILLKDLCQTEDRIGKLTIGMLVAMIDEYEDAQADEVPVIKEEDEDDISEDETDSDLQADPHILEHLQLEPGVAQEVYQMLINLQGGMKRKGCNCEPGKPHTCMSPSASAFVSQITSLAHSLSHSIAASLSATAHQSRRQSVTAKSRKRMSLTSGITEDSSNHGNSDSDDEWVPNRASSGSGSPREPPPLPMGKKVSLSTKRGSASKQGRNSLLSTHRPSRPSLKIVPRMSGGDAGAGPSVPDSPSAPS